MNRETMHSLRTPSLLLAAALQVMPIVRAALPVTQQAANLIVILFRWGAGAAAALGGVQAVSGASTVITNPLTKSATNGQPFSLRLTTAPDQAHYWTASPLPTGITLTGTSGSTLWKLEGTPTVSGTFNVLLTAKDQASSGGSRTVSATLVLTVISLTPTPPSIVTQPTNKTVNTGQSATFTVAAGGSGPLSYQWRFGGSDLNGKTNTSLTLSGVTTNQAGGYDVVVTNSLGSITSVVASLSVKVPPSIAQQPASQTITAGQSATFSVAAVGTAPLKYFWRKGTTPISGATNSTYAIASAQVVDSGSFSVIVSNVAGTATSSAASLTVNPAPRPPSITAQPTNRTVEVGSSTAFAVTAAGTGPLIYQWYFDGLGLDGETNSVLALNLITTNAAGAYQVVITNSLGGVTSAVATLTVTPSTDFTKPTLTVTAPTSSTISVASNSFRLTGTAKDNAAVATVRILRPAAPEIVANGTTNWWASAELAPGTNLLRVVALDAAGNASITNARTIVLVVTSPLTVLTQGVGKVTGYTNGQRLEIGKGYKATAVPGMGQVFSNWTGGVGSSANPLTFTMESNLVVQANFVPNPFAGPKGAYHGLFFEPNQVRHECSGLFKATLAESGTFTATLQIGRQKARFSGRFDLDGHATNLVVFAKTNSLTVELNLDLAGGAQITGRVTNANGSANLQADRAGFDARMNPALTFSNRYTIALAGNHTNATTAPGGDGFGTVKVDAGGKLTFAGALADGTKVAQRVPISAQGHWPLYVYLYSGKGSVLGWVTLTNTPAEDLGGLLSWTRPAGSKPKQYTNGFAVDRPVTGSIYTSPGTNLLLATTNLIAAFAGGNLAAGVTNNVMLAPANKFINTSTNKLSLAITAKTGLFKGSVTPPGTTTARAFSGALLRKHGYGVGYFLGTNESGNVYVGD